MHRLGLLIVLLIQGVAWGAQFSMLKLAVQGGYDEITVLFIALVLISVGYFVFLLIGRRVFLLTKESSIFFVITAVLGYVIPLFGAIYAAPHLPAGIMTLIATLTPIVTICVALALRTERVSPGRLVAVALGSVAAILVLTPQLELPGLGAIKWMLLIGLVPLCYGVESIYIAARWPANLDAWQLGFGEAAVAAVLLFPMFLIYGNLPNSFAWTHAETGILLFVVAGLIEVVLYFYIIQRTGGVLISFSNFVSLFAGIGWGILLFGEMHGISVWLAVLVLLAALTLVCVDSMQREDFES